MTSKLRSKLEIYTSVRQRNMPLTEKEKSIAEEIKIIKDKGASCSSCSSFCTKRFMTFCNKKNKAVKSYNICTEHNLKTGVISCEYQGKRYHEPSRNPQKKALSTKGSKD